MTTVPTDHLLDCDVVMKGGITSGVIYPLAVCELAESYRLRSIGGSSAGAIAAVGAAAAEKARSSGGFDRLATLPTDITAALPGGRSVLFGLFQPQHATAALFRAFTAGLGRSGAGRSAATAWGVLRGFALWAVCGAVPGVLLLVVGILGEGAARWAAAIGGVLVALVGVVAGATTGVLVSLGRAIPANGFGLCSGMPGVGPPGTAALTPWLHQTVQSLAGLTPDADPLTFADLDAAGIELRMMTTNITRHEPLRIPWDTSEYFFDHVRFRELFPDDVVAWMSLPENAPAVTGGAAKEWSAQLLRAQAKAHNLLPFPAPEKLPVLVATRMSLSFPLLMSAVPLFAVNYGLSSNRMARQVAQTWKTDHPDGTVEEALRALEGPAFDVNWFSDGGIASNLPVHFFDSPIPTRPTFAFDLAAFPPDVVKSPDEAANTYLPTVNQGGLLRRWTTWPTRGLGSLLGLGMAIVNTARGWVDESQLAMPGYRDRVVTIYHDKAEGGINLDMEASVVQHLVARGRAGAAKLVDRFATGEGWDNQRWVRFRSATAGLEIWLSGFRRGYTTAPRSGTPYSRLAGPGAGADLPSYQLTVAQRGVVNDRTGALLDLADTWEQPPADAFTAGAPRPSPVLRLVPGKILGAPSQDDDD